MDRHSDGAYFGSCLLSGVGVLIALATGAALVTDTQVLDGAATGQDLAGYVGLLVIGFILTILINPNPNGPETARLLGIGNAFSVIGLVVIVALVIMAVSKWGGR